MRHTMFATGVATGKTAAETTALGNIPKFAEGTYQHGVFVPQNPLKYRFVAQVTAPQVISDPSHLGHAIWKACKFLETVDDKVIESRLEKVETDGNDEAVAESEGQDDKDEDDGDDEDELEDDGGNEGQKHDHEEQELDEDDAAANKSMKRKRKTQKMLKRKRGKASDKGKN